MNERSPEKDAIPPHIMNAESTGFPNLFLVGAAKAGTTALHGHLARHPDIYAPEEIKELNFMAFEGVVPPSEGPGDRKYFRAVMDRSGYLDLYRPGASRRWLLDASPSYLVHEQAALKINQYSPDSRIIMILRNPAYSAFSMHTMLRRDRREPEADFLRAFRLSEKRIAAGWEWAWNHASNYCFGEQVARYLSIIPRDRLLILRYEDWHRDNQAVLRTVAGLLDIPTGPFSGGQAIENTAPTRRHAFYTSRAGRFLRPMLARITPFIPTAARRQFSRLYFDRAADTISPHERRVVQNHYARDVEKLEQLLGWDLSSWKTI